MTHMQADALILRVAGGDMAALEELYNALAKQVYAYALSLSQNRQTAEDVMQDTFVRVYSGAKKFRPQRFGVAWIMRIARNITMDALSRKGSTYEPLDENIDSAASVEDTAVDKTVISDAVSRLSESEREVFVLHAVSGMKMNEIAQMLDQPEGTVKWRHSQALKKMKKYIGTEVAQ